MEPLISRNIRHAWTAGELVSKLHKAYQLSGCSITFDTRKSAKQSSMLCPGQREELGDSRQREIGGLPAF